MKDLIQLQNEVADHLGIDPLPIRFEDIGDEDSRLYFFMRKHIVINSKYKDNYIECAKCITHEYRHSWQLYYIHDNDDVIAKRWKEDFEGYHMGSDSDEYFLQSIEVDAFAFTKYYLKKFLNIDVINHVEGLDKIIDLYIKKNLFLLELDK